ncbi:hypothetical protein NESM_000594600 [Novymonas esmeraldas]|uniref:Uncharacterized protein n=1 Tax=Novymonas esmeraldas TaxID=1808958 RepID=A0AAW0ET25_9TRYP
MATTAVDVATVGLPCKPDEAALLGLEHTRSPTRSRSTAVSSSPPPPLLMTPAVTKEEGCTLAVASDTSGGGDLTLPPVRSSAAGDASHSHPHLLRLLAQQQARIAALQASLARAVESARHASEVFESLPGRRCSTAAATRVQTTKDAPPASPTSRAAAVAAVPAVAASVRWADVVAAVPPSVSSATGVDEVDTSPPSPSPSPERGSHTAPTSCSVLPVILLDVTSMFTTRTAAVTTPSTAPPRHRRSMETQTEPAAAAELVAGEAWPPSCEPCTAAAGGSKRFGAAAGRDVAPQDRESVDAAHTYSQRDMEELHRLRLLLRFSELKKDSDRLTSVEEALRISSAAQQRLRQRCERLEREATLRGDCLRAVASCVESTLAAAGRAALPAHHRSDASTAAAPVPVSSPIPEDLVTVLEYMRRLCTDAAPSPGGCAEPPPCLRPSPPLHVAMLSRQDRVHKAIRECRDGGRPLLSRPPSRTASWRGSDGGSSADVAVLDERRASKQ